jgi:hypothetical protein
VLDPPISVSFADCNLVLHQIAQKSWLNILQIAMDGTTIFTVILVIALVFGALYLIDPTLFGLLGSKFQSMPTMTASEADMMAGSEADMVDEEPPATEEGFQQSMSPEEYSNFERKLKEGFQNNETAGAMQAEATGANPNVAAAGASAEFGNAEAPAGCYPRDQLTPSELLPKDPNSVWAQQNPMGTGSLKGKNFLSAGALIGVNTVGQSMRNANLQLRSEPPNPQMPVSIFNVPTIEPDINRRPLEIG